jgi:hypothetical protein
MVLLNFVIGTGGAVATIERFPQGRLSLDLRQVPASPNSCWPGDLAC